MLTLNAQLGASNRIKARNFNANATASSDYDNYTSTSSSGGKPRRLLQSKCGGEGTLEESLCEKVFNA